MSGAIGPGSLVRCVEEFDAVPGYPVRGNIYTVRALFTHTHSDPEDIGIDLCDLPATPPCLRCGVSRGFDIRSFVPVDDGEIQIFRDLAANPKEKVPA